ncbi:synaptonemal complex protein 1, isoform CRA_b [Rattus norvegicus]|uniref:Synaptonemal complex protein 1, isoform CRA_b n=1 Tax=Rattus norvegicus TaxID=10116 RepID=A6K3J5_RAT|nr:synaptonemal complex protein 1, isoform CRA_b [Rattus norvegicus]
MEKQKPFTLFVPPRLSSSQVSAVKPQTAGGDSNYFKTVNKCTEGDFGVPLTMSSLSKNRENIDTDPAFQKLSILPMLEQVANSGSCHYQEGVNDSDFENSEPMSRLYSKLYKEAEKIKKWKVSIESELKQKENKLQENRKIIEAQRKAIQELQFENEKVSLKLEEEIQENKDLIKENNATRHWCNLLKETCARSAEKTSKYEYEREETRQVYVDLNNNIEKMILAFEELRVQAENARLEMHFKLKEDHEKIQHLEEEYQKEVNNKENQVSLLLIQSTEKENKMKDLTFLLEESRDKANQLEEKTKLQDENLKELNEKKDHLTSELEDIKMSMQRSMSTQKTLEEDLQIATKTIYQLTEEKEAQMEELNKAKTTHSLVVTELKATTCTLEELLRTEQQRLENNEDQLKLITMELQKKSSELEEMTKFKNNKEVELEELKTILKEIHDLEVQVTVTKTSEEHYLKQVEEMKTELEKEKLKNIELTANCDMLLLENKKLVQEASDMVLELKKHQEDIINCKKQEERMLKQIETLEEKEMNLRDELESVRKEFIQQGDEVKCKLDKSEENARSIEYEVLKKEKQMKILENKCNNLKKQIENKSKNIEELHQENKALKKKSSAENKQLNAYEIKVNKLELELASTKQKFEEMINNYQKEIEIKKISEEKLLGEVEKAKATVDEAVKLQKEIDLRCQHKIAEMVALMEKHKHQYDKIVEERDSELGLYKNREQEQSSAKVALETELSNIRNELVSLKKQLEVEKEEKEKLKMEQENTAILTDKKDKKIQASLLESPEATSWKFDSKTTPSQNISRLSSSMDSGKSKDNRDSLRASAKSILSTTVTKEYTVKTPTKKSIYQRENKYLPTGGSNKKRKTVFEFDVNSDSSETTDLLSLVSEEDISNRIYNNNTPDSHLLVKTPKQTPLSLSTPASFTKFGSLKKMREDRWATIAKIDRKRRLKEAEKLFT